MIRFRCSLPYIRSQLSHICFCVFANSHSASQIRTKTGYFPFFIPFPRNVRSISDLRGFQNFGDILFVRIIIAVRQ
ncbi:Uncharacterized protein dnm_061410 [Desulfonema magnum]|uniref:Uncharacterized protein n=1 Tax=Desulfonema magnum TaxID=45655 RepID=A0A975BR70_9BACT|nr:Uncharacterized protein dnm_061410 [Desulfonema magnum]